MNVIEGHGITSAHEVDTDVVIVGTGPAGAAVARTVARLGLEVVLLDEGPFVEPSAFPADGFTAMARLYRDMGASLSLGKPMMPLVQGRVVGGTSVINGAISWRLPKDVHAEWIAADPALEETMPWSTVDPLFDRIEDELNIRPTEQAVSGPNNLLLARGAEALGIEHRPIRRNVRGCRGLGRCLQGCPESNKMSMDISYLPDACRRGARIFSEVRVDRVIVEGGRAVGIVGVASGGGGVTARARHAVVVAASVIQTPALLIRSGIDHGPVGHGFQGHPGVAVSGRFPEPVRMWTGATQGHEAIGLRKQGIKFEALGYDMALVATRLKGVGRSLSRDIADLAHQAHWGAAIRAEARGRVHVRRGRTIVRYSMTKRDIGLVRRGVRVLAEMMLAAGADYVEPGVFGYRSRIDDPRQLDGFDADGPGDPTAYSMAITHMFGTCRMGSDKRTSVVRPDLRHHWIDGLYVADSSVFPSNTGVNPQTSIIALATLCGRAVANASA